jgi:hypothetical protein
MLVVQVVMVQCVLVSVSDYRRTVANPDRICGNVMGHQSQST